MQCNVLDKDTSHNVFSTEHVVFSLLATLSGNIGSANRLWAQITRVPAVNAVNQNSRYLLNSAEAFICWMRKREKNGVRLELTHNVEIEVY